MSALYLRKHTIMTPPGSLLSVRLTVSEVSSTLDAGSLDVRYFKSGCEILHNEYSVFDSSGSELIIL